MFYCSHCVQDSGTTDSDGYVSCALCGMIITFVSTRKGTRTIEDIAAALGIEPSDAAIDRARCLYVADCCTRDVPYRGCLRTRLAAACLYAALRLHDRPFLLVDISDHLRVTVYALGVMFVQLCSGWAEVGSHVADPSLYIHRFAKQLLGRADDEVSIAALRIIAGVERRDWMSDRKLTSRICVAALYVAAVGSGYEVSKKEVVDAVDECEASLDKQSVDFGDTRCSTVEKCVPCPWLPQSRMACKHKSADRAAFACGLCRECYDEFVQLCDGEGI